MKDIDKAKIKLGKRKSDVSLDNFIAKTQKIAREGTGNCRVTQKMLDAAILRFIIGDIQPLAVIYSPDFINLVRMGIPASIKIMCKKTLKQKIDQAYLEMKSTLDKKLSEIDIVSTTADLWSKMKRLIQSFVIF